jgi:16S rRNA (cytosine1402-N4)-methyltransferase
MTHAPVLLDEVRELLAPERGGVFVDCTVGLGGHAQALLEAGASRLIGLDRDRSALALARERLAGFGDRVELVHADFRTVAAVLEARGLTGIDGALADLGVSSMQLDAPGRGFSFRRDEALDMRMDVSSGVGAAEAIRTADERTLADVIYRFGEERYARRIARAVVAARAKGPIETTGQLAELVRRAVPRRGPARIDPATRTFQALRIWVNGELEGLDAWLERLAQRLNAGGRLAVVAFHSLEDRIVKHTLRSIERGGGFTVLTKRPVRPGEAEIERNGRARSAKLRALARDSVTAERRVG